MLFIKVDVAENWSRQLMSTARLRILSEKSISEGYRRILYSIAVLFLSALATLFVIKNSSAGENALWPQEGWDVWYAGDLVIRERSLSSGNEDYFQRLARTLPIEYTLEENDGTAIISWAETDGLRNLHCALLVYPLESSKRQDWITHTLVSVASEAG